MCLAVVALDAHPEYPLIIAANRDEYHARAAAPATWGREPPFVGILAGRDLLAGGTWLGVRGDGRWALVTNVRDGRGNDPAARSRGELVPSVLNAQAPPGPSFAELGANPGRYNGFNLIAGDAGSAVWMSNRSVDVRCLSSGVHGLSNALLDTPWPKLVRTVDRFRYWTAHGDSDTAPLFSALADRNQAPDDALPDTGVTCEWERLLSSPFIVGERYGTRCSTVFTVDRRGRARFVERSFAPDGTPASETVEEFGTQ